MDASVIDKIASPLDLSLEAALELEEYKQELRNDTPALQALLKVIRTPAPAFRGQGMSMLADVRAYPLLRDSLSDAGNRPPNNFREFHAVIEKYLTELETGVAARNPTKIVEAKRFCLAFNSNLLAKQMSDV